MTLEEHRRTARALVFALLALGVSVAAVAGWSAAASADPARRALEAELEALDDAASRNADGVSSLL